MLRPTCIIEEWDETHRFSKIAHQTSNEYEYYYYMLISHQDRYCVVSGSVLCQVSVLSCVLFAHYVLF